MTQAIGANNVEDWEQERMASEQRLYTFSPSTREQLRKFRLGTSRAKDPQAVIYSIEKQTLSVQQASDAVYSSMRDLADDLPDNQPRFVLLSYPLTMSDGRISVPYVLIAYMPSTTSSEQRMLYAGAKELMRKEAETNRAIDVEDAEDMETIDQKLKGDE